MTVLSLAATQEAPIMSIHVAMVQQPSVCLGTMHTVQSIVLPPFEQPGCTSSSHLSQTSARGKAADTPVQSFC